MKLKISNRQSLSIAIIFFYLVPLLFFASYSIGLMSRNKSWSILSIGLLMVVCGALSLILLLYYWEEVIKQKCRKESLASPSTPNKLLNFPPLDEKENKVTSLPTGFNEPAADAIYREKENSKELSLLQTALEESQETHVRLLKELQLKDQEKLKLDEEVRQLNLRVNQVTQDFSDYKIFSEEQLKQKNLQINHFQQTVEDQKTELERRMEQVTQLSSKVNDLSYEIKTLVHLNESDEKASKEAALSAKQNSGQTVQRNASSTLTAPEVDVSSFKTDSLVETPGEASELLKRCINIAQKLAGAQYYGSENSRYRDLSSPYYAIDQRRLFDSLRSEMGALIFVYSPKEHKLLFVNNQVKTMLGWSAEKFAQDFLTIIEEGLEEWKYAINQLNTHSEFITRLVIKSKTGQKTLFNCHLGVITTGLFRHHLIGVSYPV